MQPLAELAPITIKAGIETLEGDIDQGKSFITPFATLHAFQGWADAFAGASISGVYGGQTAGIEDTYLSISSKLVGANILAAYHEYEPDDSSSLYDKYGNEINLSVSKRFGQNYLIGLKYSDFESEDNYSVDTEKLWTWLQVKF